MTWRHYLFKLAEETARGYGWVSLLPSWRFGVPLGLMTLLDPWSGLHGLAGGLIAWHAGELAGAGEEERPVCVFNGLLVGLFIGHVWIHGFGSAGMVAMGGVLSGWLTVVLGRLAWSLVQMPVLSLPFTLVAMLTGAAGGSLSALQQRPYVAPTAIFGDAVDRFLSAFGNFYFSSEPLAGMCVLAVLLLASRYYVAIALLGYGTAQLWLQSMGAAPEHLAGTAWGTNAILAAMLVGGLFARPSGSTALLAALTAGIAAWLSLALGRILTPLHLLPYSVPFVAASWLVLYAAVRNARLTTAFNLLLPDLPERSHERARINMGRVGSPASVPLAVPFLGTWTILQGVAGAHTHRGSWRHALDFIITRDGQSFINQGSALTDFLCYGQPVLSPVHGQVWRVVNDVPDNPPGTVNAAANWGNCVVIRLADGKWVVLAHLIPGSVAVAPGDWLKPGDYLGTCGNSGRSPQPHIHLHVQSGDDPGAPTVPFHLASVLVAEAGGPASYLLAATPNEGAAVSPARTGDIRPFYLLAGRGIRYTVTRDGAPAADWSLHCEVDQSGRLMLVSNAGARCLADSTWATFACHERSGKPDPCFDLWLLACGFTPASDEVDHWREAFTPARLLPGGSAPWSATLFWPWAAFAVSLHRRRWDDAAQAWQQEAEHRQRLFGITIHTSALLVPEFGCTHLEGEAGSVRYVLEAASTFQQADVGVPAWEEPIGGHISLRRLV
ncbi:MAG: urea transporter [Magnetococcales bacterium]|nr:urea transporter [Magnetococcales bacterium]